MARQHAALYQCFNDTWLVSGKDVSAEHLIKKTDAFSGENGKRCVSFLLQPALNNCRQNSGLQNFVHAVVRPGNDGNHLLDAALSLFDMFTLVHICYYVNTRSSTLT